MKKIINSNQLNTLALSGQWFAGVVCLGGIIVELITGGHIGHILITVGAVMFAVFTKVRYYKNK